LASKVNTPNLSKDKLIEACERSLKNLNTDYIDLYQIHWPNRSIDMSETLEALKALHSQHKIRSIGVSNYGALDTAQAVSYGVPIVTNQLPYSLVTRAIEYNIVQSCQKHNLKILAYSPMAQGLLTGKYKTLEDALKNQGLCRSRLFHKSRSSQTRHDEEGAEEELFQAINSLLEVTKKYNENTKSEASPSQVALAWALSQGGISCVLIGASQPHQIKDNVGALQVKNNISADLLNTLTASSNAVKLKLGANPDLWDSGDNARYR